MRRVRNKVSHWFDQRGIPRGSRWTGCLCALQLSYDSGFVHSGHKPHRPFEGPKTSRDENLKVMQFPPPFFFLFSFPKVVQSFLTSKTSTGKLKLACLTPPQRIKFVFLSFSDAVSDFLWASSTLGVLVWHVKNATAVQLSVRTAYLMPTFLSQQWSLHTYTGSRCFHQNSSAFHSNTLCISHT